MNAFIYAAGRATRLGKLAQDRHKIMLEFGGKTLLEWHALRLAEIGAQRMFVITGFLREAIADEIQRLNQKYPIAISEIHNPDFTEGSVLSVAVSLSEVEKCSPHALLLDGDVLYDGRMLRQLVASKHPTVLLVDRGYSAADDDPVLVPINNGKPFDFVKKWRGEADILGESIGFFKVATQDLHFLAAQVRSRMSGVGRMDSYDEVLRDMVRKGLFHYEDVTGIPWTEIDFPGDVTFANETVLPAILKGVNVVA